MSDIPYCSSYNGWIAKLSCERCELKAELRLANETIGGWMSQFKEAQQQIAELRGQLGRPPDVELVDELQHAHEQIAELTARYEQTCAGTKSQLEEIQHLRQDRDALTAHLAQARAALADDQAPQLEVLLLAQWERAHLNIPLRQDAVEIISAFRRAAGMEEGR